MFVEEQLSASRAEWLFRIWWYGQEEDARELVDAMVENSTLESLVQRLSSFNESVDEEATAVTNTLSIFENMIELTPRVRCLRALIIVRRIR